MVPVAGREELKNMRIFSPLNFSKISGSISSRISLQGNRSVAKKDVTTYKMKYFIYLTLSNFLLKTLFSCVNVSAPIKTNVRIKKCLRLTYNVDFCSEDSETKVTYGFNF